MSKITIYASSSATRAGGIPDIPTIVRDPLPPWPASTHPYATTLPADWPPANPTRDFLRANCWTLEVPGLPWVPGASSLQPQRFLSWFFDRYPRDYGDRWLELNRQYGYTHAYLSAADSMGPTSANPGCPPGAGQSLAQFIDTCGYVKSVMPFVHVFVGSKCFQPRDMSPAQWADYADPIMEALIDAGVVDEFTLGWEWDLWNTPGDSSVAANKHAGQVAHAGGCSFWHHFSTHVTSWFADGDPRGRFGYWEDLGRDVDGIDYQAVCTVAANPDVDGPYDWSADMLQARIVDTLYQFGQEGNIHKFRVFEDMAMLSFDHNPPTEADNDQRGYLACCTVDNVKGTDAKVWGYGGGGRRPDGSPL